MRKHLIIAAAIGALSAVGCNSDCEQACEDWADTCSEAWDDTEATCSDNCDLAANHGWEAQETDCYACYSRHKELCTETGSETHPGSFCFETCNFDMPGTPTIVPMPDDYCWSTCTTLGLCHDTGLCFCLNRYGAFSSCGPEGTSAAKADCCEAWSNAECAASDAGKLGDNYLCSDGACGSEFGCAEGRWWQ